MAPGSARPQLWRLRVHRVLPARHVPVHARSEPRAATADLSDVDTPGRSEHRCIHAARGALRIRHVRSRRSFTRAVRRDAAIPHEILEHPDADAERTPRLRARQPDRKSTRLNSSHEWISYAVFCLKKKNQESSLADASDRTLHRTPN